MKILVMVAVWGALFASAACAQQAASAAWAQQAASAAGAQQAASAAGAQHAGHDGAAMPPMAESGVFSGVALDRLEARGGAGPIDVRWQGAAWFGTDLNRVWIKTDGSAKRSGRVEDGRHEAFYNRAVSTWADIQVGLRADLDSRPGRYWGALGAHGTAPMFLGYDATAYLSDAGHAAARIALSYELPVTETLILQTEVETNIHSRADPARRVGAGVSEIEAGFRLRHEFSRKFAPYIGVSYAEKLGETARMARRDGEKPGAARVLVGIRARF